MSRDVTQSESRPVADGRGAAERHPEDVRFGERARVLAAEAREAREFELLHRAMNDWLTMYARCYGVDLDADFTVREAAEVLLRTHDVVDTAQLLTCVPERR